MNDSYDSYPLIERAFQEALDESLQPRGPEMLYEIVATLGLPAGASVIDVGCGEGRQSIELARRSSYAVLGVDPVERQLEGSREALAEAATSDPALPSRVRFALGSAEKLPVAEASVDLVWCREVLVLVAALDRAFAEVARVLRPGGRALVYQVFNAERLEPKEAVALWRPLLVAPESADPQRTERAMREAGLRIDECIVIGSEWGERLEETSSAGTRRLLHAARLLRSPERYIARFGRVAYDIMLSDCLWHVYRMIGKLAGRAYVLSKPAQAR